MEKALENSKGTTPARSVVLTLADNFTWVFFAPLSDRLKKKAAVTRRPMMINARRSLGKHVTLRSLKTLRSMMIGALRSP